MNPSEAIQSSETLVAKINEVLKHRQGSIVNIINDKLTLSVFSELEKNLHNVKQINFIIRDTGSIPSSREIARPQQYAVGKPFEIGTFLTADLTPKEKKRFRDAAAAIALAYQVAGESVPSRIDDTYDCQAILAFDVKITALKEAAFVCGVIQRLVKPLCVVRAAGPNSFAHKRLHQADRKQAVVTDAIVTAVTLPGLRDDTADLLDRYCSFDRLRNRTNKLGLYAEWMAKAYACDGLVGKQGTAGVEGMVQ